MTRSFKPHLATKDMDHLPSNTAKIFSASPVPQPATGAPFTQRLVHYSLRALIVALVGALNTLSFAPTAQGGWLGFVTFAFSCALIMRTRTVREAMFVGGSLGFGQFVSGLFWLYISMHTYGEIPSALAIAALILVALYLALYPLLAAALWRICTPHSVHATNRIALLPIWRSSLAFASAWTLAEWLRGTVFTGFPWLALGYAQMDGPLIGFASIVGVYGISWLFSWLTALLVQTLARFYDGLIKPGSSNALARLIAPMMVITALITSGLSMAKLRWTSPHGTPLNVRLLQGNVPQDLKFQETNLNATLIRYQQLITEQAADLIITPETALPFLISQVPASFAQAVREFADRTNSTILLGAVGTAPTSTGELGFTNSLFGLTPYNDELYQYNKSHLVPFGEFVPWGFRWFVDAMKIPLTDFVRGSLQQNTQHLFSVRGQPLALGICYEDVFGEELARTLRQAPKSASLLVNATNLGWFGNTIALDQHLQMARMRALETGRPVLRATNTGATAAIDYDGRVLAQLPTFTIGALNVQVQGRTGFTPYIAYGNLPVLLVSLVIMLSLIGWRLRSESKPSLKTL